MSELPWSDCKIAFGYEGYDPEDVWIAYGLNGNALHKLPEGWRLCETDGAGARWVAVFRVECVPTVEDGKIVEALLTAIAVRTEKARNRRKK
jgi:hypothetical protein